MDVVVGARHFTAARQFTTASYALAVYEYLITLDREIDTFWQRKFSFPTILWFLNRYTLLFSTFPTLTGFFGPLSITQYVLRKATSAVVLKTTSNRCEHFIKFPGAMQIISNIASGSTLSLRVYALYGQARWVIIVLAPVFLAEIALESWAVDGGTFAPLPPGEKACILTGRPDEGIRFAVFWMGQLVFPTLIFVMTVTRAIRLRRYVTLKGSILNVMLRDGVMYFLVIFFVNLVNVVTYVIAPVDLKFVNAPFTNVITTIMICRLMLNLRRTSELQPVLSAISAKGDERSRRTLLFGNLGEDIDINNSNDETRQRELRGGVEIHANRQREGRESGIELYAFVEQQYR